MQSFALTDTYTSQLLYLRRREHLEDRVERLKEVEYQETFYETIFLSNGCRNKILTMAHIHAYKYVNICVFGIQFNMQYCIWNTI